MIVGNGMIASEFSLNSENYLDAIIFASGVSNSNETNENEFNYEKKLLLKTINENRELKLIYFSCMLVEILNNDYYKAKLDIEELIKNEASDYIIFRLPQIIGNNGNPTNLANYIKYSIINDVEIIVYGDAERALVDVEDLVNVVNYCKNKISCETLNFSYVEKFSTADIGGTDLESEKIPDYKEIKQKITDFETKEKENKIISKKFNAGMIMDKYPELRGEKLGKALSGFKSKYDNFRTFVLDNSTEQILNDFDEFMINN